MHFNRTGSMLFLLLVCLCFSCSKKKSKTPKLILDSRYEQIDHIATFAKCKGPKGHYTTTIESFSNGSCFFQQLTQNSRLPFTSKITSDLKGYVLDTLGKVIDTLSGKAVEMIRSHDFHRLHTNPRHFFDSIVFNRNLANNMILFKAKDRLQHPVSIYYDKTLKLITKIELLNPLDTVERIEIKNIKWTESNYGKLAKEIEIIQAKRDTFHFYFETIAINK